MRRTIASEEIVKGHNEAFSMLTKRLFFGKTGKRKVENGRWSRWEVEEEKG